jgi:hypothetical protein
MTKPANFPERKRQRQERALSRLALSTAGKPDKGIEPRSNLEAIKTLKSRVDGSKRDVRTKKDRTVRGRFSRAA